MFWPAGPAAAHAVVVASEPPAGATLGSPPARMVVRFNSRIDHGRSRLTLVGPNGGQTVLDPMPEPAPEATVLRGETAGVAWAPGGWRLRWQVLAIDGHITRGDIPFTLRAP